jgi:hypothetical protein
MRKRELAMRMQTSELAINAMVFAQIANAMQMRKWIHITSPGSNPIFLRSSSRIANSDLWNYEIKIANASLL